MSVTIDHVGIAVQELDERLRFWSETLGLPIRGIEIVSGEHVRVAYLEAGASRIELLEPTDAASPVARFLERRGEGIHHLTLAVDDLEVLLAHLRAQGVSPLGEAPRIGGEGREVAFLPPAAAGGVLIELVQARRAAAAAAPRDIVPGSVVLAYMREPQEKLWGMLRRLDGAGLVLEGIDLGSFDEWISQFESGEESVIGPSVLFVPMTRIDKILLDRPNGPLPSLEERFERRTGLTLAQALAEQP